MKKTPSPLPEDYIQREFETYRKAFAVGNEWGLADAMTLCKEYPSVPLPSWAVDVLRERHADAYHGAYKRSANRGPRKRLPNFDTLKTHGLHNR